ncbi:hypothetical protein ACQKMV_18530 [Lysinibacillus sp. NPDC094403]|uniref:hypothetical protein n=1 Tax=Lysinibacillus sp. NPDC094403 TaxID=3390581 RepID=UPI003D014F3F
MQVSITFLWYAFCYRHLTSFGKCFFVAKAKQQQNGFICAKAKQQQQHRLSNQHRVGPRADLSTKPIQDASMPRHT